MTYDANSKVKSGVTSVSLDTETLQSAAGLSLSGTNNTVDPTNDHYAVGFSIDKDSSFVYNNRDGFTPVSGTIEHTGTVTFDTDSLGAVTVGDFSVGYDATRKSDNASGFYVQDTAGIGAILFDVGNPDSLSANRRDLSIGNADLLVSHEFNSFLNQQGLANQNLTGADVGDVGIEANARPVGIGNKATPTWFDSATIFEVDPFAGYNVNLT